MTGKSAAKVAVVGAGPGGLAAAMLLAAKGYEVEVFEKQDTVGGRSGELRLGEYRFDRGATFLMMPHLLEELFTMAGRSLHSYVSMKELNPLYSLHFGETVFRPSTDQEQTAAEIERLFPGNGAGYRRFMADEDDKFTRVMPLLQRPFQSPADYIKEMCCTRCLSCMRPIRCTTGCRSILTMNGCVTPSPFRPNTSGCRPGNVPARSRFCPTWSTVTACIILKAVLIRCWRLWRMLLRSMAGGSILQVE